MSLADARGRADRLKRQIKNGLDPQAQKVADRAAAIREAAKADQEGIRFSKVCDAYIAEEFDSMWPATRVGWARFIEREIKPALGDMSPESITPGHIADLRHTIERGIPGPKKGTWKRKPAPVSARRMFEVLRRILAWLSTADPETEHARKRHGLNRLEANPAAPVATFRRKRAGRKTRAEASAKAYTDDQLRRLFTAAEDAVAQATAEREAMNDRKVSGPTAHETEARALANLLALVAHTGVRAHDARGPDGRTWTSAARSGRSPNTRRLATPGPLTSSP